MHRLIFTFLLATTTCVAHAATYQVTRADDPVMAPCTPENCSLRSAIAMSAITPEADLILLPAGVFSAALNPLRTSGDITIRGAGSTLTSLHSTSDQAAIMGSPMSELVIEGMRISAIGSTAIEVTDGSLVLRDVDMPNDTNQVIVEESTLSVSLRVESSRIPSVACISNTASCTLRDSAITTIVLLGTQAELDAQRIVSAGSGTTTGLHIGSNGAVRVTDSLFSNHTTPLNVDTADADILIERTRFIGNTGPMLGNGGGMARLDDVEFSDNIVSDANITLPAVLHATDGTAWRIHRALFDGNRGGSGGSSLGAVIATEPGANVAMTNVTFTNNTYRPGVVSAHAHAIGVVSTAANPSMMWLFHATMRRPAAMAASEQGSLLRISGAGAYVLLKNSVVDGTCLFNNGGSVMQAEGSIESPGNTCGLDIATNFVGITQNQLRLGALADNGGFTWSAKPNTGSVAINRATTNGCLPIAGMDQRRYLRPAGGIGCDIGAVEVEGVPETPEIFDDGFE